jgi:hypothetical protein
MASSVVATAASCRESATSRSWAARRACHNATTAATPIAITAKRPSQIRRLRARALRATRSRLASRKLRSSGLSSSRSSVSVPRSGVLRDVGEGNRSGRADAASRRRRALICDAPWSRSSHSDRTNLTGPASPALKDRALAMAIAPQAGSARAVAAVRRPYPRRARKQVMGTAAALVPEYAAIPR